MSKLKKILLLFTTIIILLVIGLYLFLNLNNTTTNKSNASKNKIEDKYNNEGIDEENKKTLLYIDSIMRVSVSDKYALASLVNYPLFRPYPLRTITSEEQFIAYYDTLIEQEMIEAINSAESKWHNMYYRESEYHLEYNSEDDCVIKNIGNIDSTNIKIFQIPLSKKEKQLQKKYINHERKTLQSFDDYNIENCLELADGTVYRILLYKEIEWCDCPTFYTNWLGNSCLGTKLLALEYAPNQYDKIKTIHEGCNLAEGSCGSISYIFDDKWFNQWQCANYYILNEGTSINIFDGENFIHHPCKRTCWRDYN